MNRTFANKGLLFREQDSKNAVLLSFFMLLPVSALFPHSHSLSAVWTLALLGIGIWMAKEQKIALDKRTRLYCLFLAFSLSGAILSLARASTLLSTVLRLSFFIPAIFSRKKDQIGTSMAFVGGVLGFLALAELLLGGGKVGYDDAFLFGGLARACGPFGNPNLLAAFLLPSAMLAAERFLFRERRRLAFLLCYLSCLLGIAASFSRGALLAVGLGSLWLFSRKYGEGRVLLCVLAFLPLSTLLLPSDLTERLLSIFSPDSSVSYRFSLWKSFSRVAPSSLLFGVGEGRAAFLSLLSPALAAGLTAIEHTHSVFLHFLVSMGFLGLFLFLLLCLLSFRKKGSAGAKSALLALLIFGFFDDPLYGGQTEVIFWLSMGLI